MKNADLQILNKIREAFPFDSFREHQESTIIKIFRVFKEKRFVVLEAPTGSGKSVIGMTLARIFPKTHILTIQKMLQDQYKRDFKDIYVMKGRSNYTCSMNGENCNQGECRKDKTKDLDHFCPYKSAKLEAVKAEKTLHNFDSFYHQKQFFSRRPLMIIDECHNIESKFMNFISFTIDNKLISIKIPELDSLEAYTAFIKKDYFPVILRLVASYESEDYMTHEEIKVYDVLRNIATRIGIFLTSRGKGKEYVFEYKQDGPSQKVVFKPIEVGEYTHLIYDFADKVLLMSATILNAEQFARNSGIPLEDYEYINVPSTFPVENREIHITSELDLRWKTMAQEIVKIPKVIKRYLDMYPDEKGIIHTHTNKLVEYIRRNISSSRFLFKDDFPDVRDLLKVHERKEKSIIVASGFHEGLDLKDDLSRFQIILKVPYPSLGDKQIKRRMDVDKGYYGYLTGLKIVQSYGRSVRSKEDWCDTYILDKNFKMFYGMYKKMLPEWFKEAIEW